MIQTQRGDKWVALLNIDDDEPAFEAKTYGEALRWSIKNEDTLLKKGSSREDPSPAVTAEPQVQLPTPTTEKSQIKKSRNQSKGDA